MVSNLSQEQTKHKNSLWKHILEEHLNSTIASYDAKRTRIQAAITGLEGRIATKKAEIEAKTAEIKALEQQTTSIQPTIDAINGLLHSYCFQGFSLAAAPDGHSYQLLRPDGSEAKETLSEGERTFVTFLYFYHLPRGSISDTGIVNDRVVVFDDPISSLDSDVLFVVSNLIRKVISNVRVGTGSLKQVFLLTHNVYFHKEVTFRTDREPGRETFWTVRKCDNISTVHLHQSNPIKTSYDLLWEELRNPNGTSLTIQNSMRRILEHYFKILGGIDQDEICDKFEGDDRIVCGSLFSWINDGSHSALDDLCLSLDEHTVEKYRDVFRRIFEEMGHSQHYHMMMRTELLEHSEDVTESESETAE